MRRDTSEDRLSEAQTARALARREYQAAMMAAHPPLTQKQRDTIDRAVEALLESFDRVDNVLIDRVTVIVGHEAEARGRLTEEVEALRKQTIQEIDLLRAFVHTCMRQLSP